MATGGEPNPNFWRSDGEGIDVANRPQPRLGEPASVARADDARGTREGITTAERGRRAEVSGGVPAGSERILRDRVERRPSALVEAQAARPRFRLGSVGARDESQDPRR